MSQGSANVCLKQLGRLFDTGAIGGVERSPVDRSVPEWRRHSGVGGGV